MTARWRILFLTAEVVYTALFDLVLPKLYCRRRLHMTDPTSCEVNVCNAGVINKTFKYSVLLCFICELCHKPNLLWPSQVNSRRDFATKAEVDAVCRRRGMGAVGDRIRFQNTLGSHAIWGSQNDLSTDKDLQRSNKNPMLTRTGLKFGRGLKHVKNDHFCGPLAPHF